MPATWPVEDFRTYLRSLMNAAGIADYAELSELTGVNQTQFSNWNRGKSRPSRENLKRIAPVLGLRSPVTLYIASGQDAHEDLQLDDQPNFTVLPKPLRDLIDVYEQMSSLGREDVVLTSVSVLVAGLKAELIAEIDRRKRDQPSGQRRRAS